MATLFSAGSVFNVPFGPAAQWSGNTQLSSGNFTMNVSTSGQLGGTGYNSPLYWDTASDPTVTVTGAQNWNGQPYGPITVHIPAGAQPATGSDHPLSVVSNGTLYSFYNFTWTGDGTATASYTGIESASGSGVTDAPSGGFDGSDFDFAVGTITQQDLTQATNTGAIGHMLRIAIPTNLAESYGSSFTDIASYAGPQTMEDGFGPQQYSGTLPYGATLGIPKGTPEPADIKANEGANILWNTLETHGAMVRDTDGPANNISFSADQNVNPNDPIIQGMDQYGGEIARYLQVLSNQSAAMINGNPGSNWVAGSGAGSGSGSGGGAGSGSGGGGTKPSPGATVITPGHGSFTDSAGNVYALAQNGSAMENDAAIPGAINTQKMEFYNGNVYGEDAITGNWYTWNQQEWSPASAPPSTAAIMQSATASGDTAPNIPAAAVQPVTTPNAAATPPLALQSTAQPSFIPALH